jgi:hypothetical protein
MAPFLNVHSSLDEPAPNPDWLIIQEVQKRESLLPRKLRWLNPWAPQALERGQNVVYYAPHDPNTLAVKRVVGLPGDRVTPLPGYPGGDESVVIPYNHIWVEGDAGDRSKSVDSNYFGPISQNMIYAHVLSVWKHWQKWPVPLQQGDKDDYPAKRDRRVEKDVVQGAKLDPNQVALQAHQPFKNGAAILELKLIRDNPERVKHRLHDSATLAKYRSMYDQAKTEREKNDPDTKDIAAALRNELENIFESAGLNSDGSRTVPGANADRLAGDAKVAASKKKRYEEYLAKQAAAQQKSDPVH